MELLAQVDKYRAALDKCLREVGEQRPNIEIICVVGKPLQDWSEPDGRQRSESYLKPANARVVMYQELINNAQKAYAAYLTKSKSDSALSKVINAIDTGEIFKA